MPGSILSAVIADLGGASMASLIVVGDRLGLYRALAIGGPLTPAQLATQTGTHEQYIREWLNAHAASGYVNYMPDKGLYELTLEQAMVFADEGPHGCLVGGFQAAVAVGHSVDALANAFCSGKPVEWDDHHLDVIGANANFNLAAYRTHLLRDWIPAIPGLKGRLEVGINAVDVCCGLAYSTELLAKAFPKSDFVGVDSHVGSIAAATQRLQRSSLYNIQLQLAHAHEYQGSNLELVTMFNALHVVRDAATVAQHVFMTLRPGAVWMIVEPFAGDCIEENLHPIGRIHYCRSTLLSPLGTLPREGDEPLGAQAGEARLRALAMNAGFKSVRRVAQTPWNMILEARA